MSQNNVTVGSVGKRIYRVQNFGPDGQYHARDTIQPGRTKSLLLSNDEKINGYRISQGAQKGNFKLHTGIVVPASQVKSWSEIVLKWDETIKNIIPNVGLDDILDKYYKGSAYTASFFVGLTDGTPTVAAGDTMASHAGWTEVVAYSEGARQTLTLGAVSGQSVDNSASKAAYSINADSTTIGGALITTDSTKGGTAGILGGVAAFTGGDKSADNGDTLNVTATLTQASA